MKLLFFALSVFLCWAVQKVFITQLPLATGPSRHTMLGATIQFDGQPPKQEGISIIARTGEQFKSGVFGGLVDKNGAPVFINTPCNVTGDSFCLSATPFAEAYGGDPDDYSLVSNWTTSSKPAFSNAIDFSSLLSVGSKIFSVTHFEWPQPAQMYLSELSQDSESGSLTMVDTYPIDWASYGGLWVPCSGSVTPWNTHLGSEEYEPDARSLGEVTSIEALQNGKDLTLSMGLLPFMRYFGKSSPTLQDIQILFNPYRYGFITEVIVKEDGTNTPMKHFAMGRLAFEMGHVMPDRKTVYMTDDGENVMLAMFVADAPDDLSIGSLFGAKVSQLSNVSGGSFDVEWIELGKASDKEVQNMIEVDGIKFTDIFETSSVVNSSCPDTFVMVKVGAMYTYEECLKLKVGMEKAASHLETRRYAAYLGVTTEFSKLEGFTFSKVTGKTYFAASEVRDGMENFNRKGKGPSNRHDHSTMNHISLDYNPCGCIYEADLDSSMRITAFKGWLCGSPEKDEEGNTCKVDGLAQPDNVASIDEHGLILIGEDGPGHVNNVIWTADVQTKELKRIMSTPMGSEAVGPAWYSVTGFNYIMGAAQHPYDHFVGNCGSATCKEEVASGDATGFEAYMVYLGPWSASMAEKAATTTAPSTSTKAQSDMTEATSGTTIAASTSTKTQSDTTEATSGTTIRSLGGVTVVAFLHLFPWFF